MSHRRRTLLISLVVVPLVSVGLYHGIVSTYRHRCAWVTCAPLTWADMQALGRAAANQRNPDYRIEAVFVDLPTGTPSPALGPVPLAVRMHYGDPDGDPVQGAYPTHEFTIDTQGQVWSWDVWAYSELPAPDAQQRFARARIGPQEVYALTWEHAQQALPAPGSAAAKMLLVVTEGRFWRSEPTWSITYYRGRDLVTYYVDAETGALIERDRQE
jgi:hypothetical protein